MTPAQQADLAAWNGLGAVAYQVSVQNATATLGYPLDPLRPRLTVDAIQRAVAAHYVLTKADLISPCRARWIARPRQVAMWLAKQLTARSLPDIGRRFGGRDHTTVLHAIRRIEALILEDPKLAKDCETLRTGLVWGRPA